MPLKAKRKPLIHTYIKFYKENGTNSSDTLSNTFISCRIVKGHPIMVKLSALTVSRCDGRPQPILKKKDETAVCHYWWIKISSTYHPLTFVHFKSCRRYDKKTTFTLSVLNLNKNLLSQVAIAKKSSSKDNYSGVNYFHSIEQHITRNLSQYTIKRENNNEDSLKNTFVFRFDSTVVW